MILQSKYKYDSSLGIRASKLAYKLNRSKKDKIVFWSIPIGLLIMIGILIFDLKRDNNLVLDFVLIGLLIAVETLNLVMPIIISKSQIKYFKKLDNLEYDYFISEFNKGIFKEKVYKDNELILANQISIEKLKNYGLIDNYMVLVFSNFAMLVFDMDNMQMGTKEELQKLVDTTIGLNKHSKKKK